MKKLNKTSDANVEFLESTRRLYRGATEIAKKLDEKKNSVSSILDIFTIENEVLRGKLKDYCERLLFKDPIGHAKKIEELLWRRGFYDAVSTAKKIVKTNEWSKIEKSLLLTHLSVGVGFYHHLILRIHLENKLDLAGFIDFAYPQNDCYYVKDIKKQNQQQQQDDEQLKECLMKIVHRSLVCLGDLARYKLEFDANWDPMIAMRYYKMAITIEPNYGMPHNQLGTLAANKNYGIDAVYYYLRSTLCTLPFEGAEGNLNRIINTNNNNNNNKLPLAPSKICANLLFNLIKKWYNNDTPTTSKNYIVDTNTNDTCQILLDNIENLLKIDKLNNDNDNLSEQTTSIDKFLKNLKSQDLPYLSDNVVFKIVSICLMLISKLKKNNSSQLNQVIAFMLSVLSKLLQVAVCRLEMSIDKLSSSSSSSTTTSDVLINSNHEKLIIKNDKSINDNENLIINKTNNKNGHVKNRVKSKSLLSKLRRPKKRVNSLDSDSSDIDEFDDDDDDDEIINNDNTSSDEYNSEKDVNSDESEQEIDESSQDDDSNDSTDSTDNDDDDDDDDNNNIENNCVANDEITINNKILMILTNEGLLQSIKICFNWLQDNQDIIKLAFKGSQLLLKRITIFFNIINININKIMKNKNIFNDESMIFSNNQDDVLNNYIKIIPLPEDIDLQGLNILNASHNNIDWKILKILNINNQEESLLRCLKIINFANYLCTIDESGLKYNDTNGYFYNDDLNKPNDNDNDKCSTSKSTAIVNDNDDDLIINNNSKGKLMRHMGELWLKAEVKALENRLKSKLMSAYLVPDHDALAKYTPLLKRLVYTKKFIIVIPSIVVSALDELKRTSGHAREATRWLEGQLKKGSRFLRAQRPQENLPLAYIKGPRPKDKEAWVFFQIIECCHYLQKQTKIDNDSNEPPVVTLLTGITRKSSPSSSSSLSFSPDGLAQNAGINLEHIESFHTKWKTSSKSHG
ncbi:protein SMG5 [Aphidius gifuensis]|uniref:protein SMG5 n=1 Tax=Aphidius gifuensis TaxID=684658 RepID=UPI001CDD8506|nr:protein SMG5 [Aphidius gifuensis]